MSEEQDIKELDMNVFRDGGFLQEANRKFFHPLGIALSVIVEDDGGNVTGFGIVWDYRDDPEGLFYGSDIIDQKKVDKIEDLRLSKLEHRKGVDDVVTDDDGIQQPE